MSIVHVRLSLNVQGQMSNRDRKQEKTEQIRKIMAEIKTDELSIGPLSDSDFSDYSDFEFSSDGLSAISDVSSVASFHLSPPQKKQKETTKKKRQSRIPVPSKPRNPGTAAAEQPKKPEVQLAKPVRYEPPPMPQPMNFLAPNLSDYTNAAICIFEGTDFPRSRLGERSTYVVVHLHPDLPVIKSPICFNKTTDAVYNGGFDLNVIGIDFSSVVPVVEVFDFISEEHSELIGLGYIQYHMAKRVDDVCVVLQDEWVNIVTVNTRMHCGRVKMSLIFHNDDTDVTEMIRQRVVSTEKPQQRTIERPVAVAQPTRKTGSVGTAPAVEEVKPASQSTAVQAEMPMYEKPRREENIMDQIGELSLTFNSPMKLWKETSLDSSSEIPTRAVVEPPVIRKVEEPKPKPKPKVEPPKPQICFVDELALDDSDDVISVSKSEDEYDEPPKLKVPIVRKRMANNSVETPKPVDQPRPLPKPRSIVKPKPAEPEHPREPLQDVNPPVEETPMKKRFAKYSDYNWY